MTSEPTNMAPVTVIIPTFNRADYLKFSLASVLDQTTPPMEVIVVDDGSSDHTQDVLAPFLDSINYVHKSNGGKASAINLALAHACGKYIWVFDDDDVASRDALERHVSVLESRPEVAFTFSGAYRCVTGRDAHNGLLEVRSANPVRPFPDNEYFIELLLSCYAGSPAVVVRRAVQKEAGLYGEDLARSQDFDMALRWSLLGSAGRLPDPRPTYYRRFHDGLRGPASNRFSYTRNIELSRQAERGILRKLDHKIPLTHYLPHEYWNDHLNDRLMHLALVRRTAVRLRHGLWPEAIEDLQRFRRAPTGTDPLTSRSYRYLTSSLENVHALEELLANAKACDEMRRILRHPEREILRQNILRGVYWLAHLSARRKQWKSARVAVHAGLRLCSAGTAFRALFGSRRGTSASADGHVV